MTPQPRLKEFYQNRALGGLYVCVQRVDSRHYVFETIAGERILTTTRFGIELEPIENMDTFLQKNPAERALYQRHVQSQPKCTGPEEQNVPRPYVNPQSPGYHPWKTGGDNPDPRKRY